MELVLKMQWFPSAKIDFTAVDDATQEHVDGEEGGWGVDTNPDRADRCLLFWSVYTDYKSVEQLVALLSSAQDVEGVVGVADGQGLINTDKSRFLVTYINDGHYIFYMLPIVRYASEPSGVEGDTYYNTTDKVAYYHNGSDFIPITSSELLLLYSAPGIAVCEELFDLKKRYCLGVKTRELLLVIDKNESKDHKEAIRELRNKDLLWRAAFKEGKQPTARKLLKSVEDECQ
jgi:hypothetical protein